MKRRVLALVCCLSLTLGLFTYRPPEAKAIVTEASLATSVLWSFMQSAGITFNGTGMNSSSWAEAIEPYLRDFTEATDSAAKSFWHWLGYDGASEFIKALSWSKITHPTTMPFPSVVIPPAAAKKMGEFTHWFVEKVGLASGGESKSFYTGLSSCALSLSDGSSLSLAQFWEEKSKCVPGDVIFTISEIQKYTKDKPLNFSIRSGYGRRLSFYFDGCVKADVWVTDKLGQERLSQTRTYTSFKPNPDPMWDYKYMLCIPDLYNYGWAQKFSYGDGAMFLCQLYTSDAWDSYSYYLNRDKYFVSYVEGAKTVSVSGFVTQPGALSPTYDDKGEKPTVVAYPNISGDLTSINDLLQQILDKLAANDLNSSASLEGEAAPDVPATDIGWKGTIEKIYQGIIDLPGRIADAFKALLEGLFAPDAALMQEMTDTFKGKFSFLTTLHKVGTDLFGMTAETDPPVIWVHLEDAEGKYTYGGPVKALDLSWYQRYKADVDKLISGFLWLAFLWLLFKRAASIIHGGEMYTEYASDIRDYYRSGKKDDGPTVPINRRLGK